MLGLRLHRGFLRHGQGQDAVFISGLDALDIDLGDVEASGVGTVVTLTADVAVLVAALVLRIGVLGLDGQNVVINVNVDVFLAKARQIGLELVAVGSLGNIRAEGVDLLLTPEGFLHLLELAQRVVAAHTIGSAVKRHDFKHFIFLLEFYTK